MNRQAYFWMVTALALGIGVALLILWPQRGTTPTVPEAKSGPAATLQSGPPPDAAAIEDDARRARIAAAYEELKLARKDLQQKLGDLKGRVWGLELPAEQARKITQRMMSAQYLLKSPPQLGAFSDVDGVLAEKVRVEAALAQLDEVSRLLGSAP